MSDLYYFSCIIRPDPPDPRNPRSKFTKNNRLSEFTDSLPHFPEYFCLDDLSGIYFPGILIGSIVYPAKID
ncbi:hypothetical protein BH10ACI3_BH10ACI3_25670 [soil metagenome]